MSDINLYAERTSEGSDSYMACDGTHHYHVIMPEDGEHDREPVVHRMGTCDGSCQQCDCKEQILEQIENVHGSKLHTGEIVERADGTLATTGSTLKSRVQISVEAQAVLDQDQIVAMMIYSWYCKRSGEGQVFHLANGGYLILSISFDEWACLDTGFHKSLKVEIEDPGDRGHGACICWNLTEDKVLACQVAQALANARE